MLFLEWFMDITQSRDYQVCKNTGWSPILYVSRCLKYYFRMPRLLPKIAGDMVPKFKLLLQMGANPHYAEHLYGHIFTPTAVLILNPFSLKAWSKALQESSSDIKRFVQRELQNGFLKMDGWIEETLFKLFMTNIDFKQTITNFNDGCNFCGSLEAHIARSWLLYLDTLKSERLDDRSDDSEKRFETDHKQFGVQEWSDDHEAIDQHEKLNALDEPEGSDNYEKIEIDHEETWYCLLCVLSGHWRLDQSSEDDVQCITSHMPGSFEPAT